MIAGQLRIPVQAPARKLTIQPHGFMSLPAHVRKSSAAA
jgi:hypothetical protein